MSHTSRWEYFLAVYARYRRADRKAKHTVLDEFCANTGYHRKYALRLLNGPPPERKGRRAPRSRAPRYSAGLVSILASVWAAAGYPWSVLLKALLPLWMPWTRKRYRLKPEMKDDNAHVEKKNGTHVRHAVPLVPGIFGQVIYYV